MISLLKLYSILFFEHIACRIFLCYGTIFDAKLDLICSIPKNRNSIFTTLLNFSYSRVNLTSIFVAYYKNNIKGVINLYRWLN